MSPSPVPNHQRVLRNLFLLLDGFVSARQLGEILWAPLDVELAPQTRIVEPDLIFIAQERIGELVGEKQITGAPDLVVEILSPRTARTDRKVKLPLYARSGVSEYWIVDLDDRAVEIYLLDGETYRVGGIFFADDTITAGRFTEAQIVVDQLFEFA
jgi:Uma2 family endonuclease